MTATILVVDDEPDLEALVEQRFRRQIRGGEFDFRFARDGVEALEMLTNGYRCRHGGQRYQHASDGRSDPAAKNSGG